MVLICGAPYELVVAIEGGEGTSATGFLYNWIILPTALALGILLQRMAVPTLEALHRDGMLQVDAELLDYNTEAAERSARWWGFLALRATVALAVSLPFITSRPTIGSTGPCTSFGCCSGMKW